MARKKVSWDDYGWDEWGFTPEAKKTSPLAINWAGQNILQKLIDDYKDAVITTPLNPQDAYDLLREAAELDLMMDD